MTDNFVLNEYFDWLYFMVVDGVQFRNKSYRKLLATLHSMEFRYFVDYDENRAADGINLRWYFVDDGGDDRILSWKQPCTVLEMLIALSMNMENTVGESGMDYRIYSWFWMMLTNLYLDHMIDEEFNKAEVYGRVSIFLDRKYEPNGDGNIIYIPDCREDLREVEIWYQMCWYLDSIL